MRSEVGLSPVIGPMAPRILGGTARLNPRSGRDRAAHLPNRTAACIAAPGFHATTLPDREPAVS